MPERVLVDIPRARGRRRCAVRRLGLAALTAVAVAGLPGQLVAEADGENVPRPNILVFLSDDMGWGQPGFNGGTEVATPHMDRIADEGVKLTQFYVQPVCTPTRGSLLTGRYDWKNGTETRVGLRSSHGMPTDERTIAEALGDAGYATWVVGKWHLGQWQQEHLPLQRGFDHHYGHYSGEINSFTLHRGRNHRGILDWHRNGRPVVETGYSTFLLADEAVALIERHDGGSPFFLYLPFNAVHNPNDAPQEYIDLYSDSSDPEQRGQLKAMDDAIGQVLDALDDKGVLDDTLIMFLNDNGGTESAGWNAPYRGKKSDYYEGALRVPAVIRWPGEITAGSESDALLHVVDLFPTFAGLAGADTTGDLPLDGLDAWEAIAEGAASPRTEVVYSLDVIRVGDWKLIEEGIDYYGWTTDAPELYDIAEDPYETTNLAATETAKLTELRARLAYHEPFARDGEALTDIPNHPPKVYGEDENEAFGAAARRAVTKLRQGNPGPSLLRMEAAGSSVKLTYSEALAADSAPSADSFKVVVNPGYASAEVTGVAVSGSAVTLTLAEAPGSGKTVGLTYEVPDADPIRDADELEAVGLTWVTAAVTTAFLSADATLSALSLSGIDIGTFSSAVTSYTASVESGGRYDHGDGDGEPHVRDGGDHSGSHGQPGGRGEHDHRDGDGRERGDDADLHGHGDAGRALGRRDAQRAEPVRHRHRNVFGRGDLVRGERGVGGRDDHGDGDGEPRVRDGGDHSGSHGESGGRGEHDHRDGDGRERGDDADLHGDGDPGRALGRRDAERAEPVRHRHRNVFERGDVVRGERGVGGRDDHGDGDGEPRVRDGGDHSGSHGESGGRGEHGHGHGHGGGRGDDADVHGDGDAARAPGGIHRRGGDPGVRGRDGAVQGVAHGADDGSADREYRRCRHGLVDDDPDWSK